MVEEDRFEILVCPENGNGVHSQIVKLTSRTFDNLDLVIREIPHVESAIELLNDGHADLIAVSGNWWHNNPQNVLPEGKHHLSVCVKEEWLFPLYLYGKSNLCENGIHLPVRQGSG